MGFRFSEDGECIVCKVHTKKSCDACKRFICDEHSYERPIPGTFKKHLFCRKCYEQGKDPINAISPGMNPVYEGI